MSGRYDKPRGWMLDRHESGPRRIAIRAAKVTSEGAKSPKKYVLATDATVPRYSRSVVARASAESWGIRNNRGNRGRR